MVQPKVGSPPPQPSNPEPMKLDDLMDQSQKILLTANTIFPLDIFTDTLTIDEHKVSITKRGFLHETVQSILIRDITVVTVDTLLFFAYLHVTNSSNYIKPVVINIGPLTVADAVQARTLIQGLVAVAKEGVQLPPASAKDIGQTMEIIGETKS